MHIAINGFGRIGRAFFKIALEEPSLEIVAINDMANWENLVYLLKRDSVYGAYDKKIKINERKLEINGKVINFIKEEKILDLPWKEMKIDVVVESTGAFEDYNKAKEHIIAGAKKVIITAPAKGEEGKDGKVVLLGINEEEINNFNIISNGSCTTNAVSPILKILDEKIGIQKAVLNTIHAYTNNQKIVDASLQNDWLRGRAGAQNIIPSTTGAIMAITQALPKLREKFDGLSIRVPIICGSLVDITFVANQKTTVSEINQILQKASNEKKFQNILGISEEPLVSSDIIKDPRPAIVDLTLTKVIDGDLVKIFIWYDNEWAYAWTLVEQLKRIKI